MKKGQSKAGDFDFLLGKWNVRHHRLKERLKGCTEWDIQDATDEVFSILHGMGNIGNFRRKFDGQPYEGRPIRFFNPETCLWSIYWADTIDFKLEPPVVGDFSDGVGTFIGEDEWEGIPIIVRFIWSDITGKTARWEQSFSTDGGNNWELNSIMEFTRVEN